jgi:hypothetical protein
MFIYHILVEVGRLLIWLGLNIVQVGGYLTKHGAHLLRAVSADIEALERCIEDEELKG